MISCDACGKNPAAKAIRICPDCLRSTPPEKISLASRLEARRRYKLPGFPPRDPAGAKCRLCSNSCEVGPSEVGFCGLRTNSNGRSTNTLPPGSALAHMYLDPLPTNCCAAWFCEASHERGYNLAVFFYGCNFDCLFCQNHSHKRLAEAPVLSEERIVQAALSPEVRCVCFFGGSPEPQLPFALHVSRRILKESHNSKRICWEWNGCGHPQLARKAAEFSFASRGTVKFDLKAFHPAISRALCGTDERRAYENFVFLHRLFPKKNLLTATTLLVPYYVDKNEVKEIAQFLSEQDKDIPYSLLAFHPDYELLDLPATPRKQAEECFEEANRFLSQVHVGNRHLL